MNTESKELIKSRMIKKAASLWGVAPNEIESSFDPLVSLLISACASEIAKISGDITSSENRVTERLLQLMTPDSLNGARPAHAIAYSEPISKKCTIAPENQFYFNKIIKDTNANIKTKNIFFSPIQEFNLVNAKVEYLLCGNQLVQFEKKEKSARAIDQKKPLQESTLFLGISCDKEKINLKNTQLFFELLDIQNTDIFYYYLQQAEFYFNGKLIDVSNNYYNRKNPEKNYIESIFSLKSNKTINAENEILKNYKKHFFTINSDIFVEPNNRLPKELEVAIDEEQYDELINMNWIEIRFSKIIPNSILQGVFCSLNAFPVMNRKLESTSYQLRNFINIVPLTTIDLFLDIKSVVNTSGKTYKIRDTGGDTDTKGSYVLRKDNIGKLDSRKAKEYLLHLIELLKEESAAFSIFGNDFLHSTINEINQNISLLEKKVLETKKETIQTNYLSIKPFKKKDTLLVDFWSTNGDEANNIKTTSTLQIYKGSELKQQQSFLLTPTFNGKNELSTEERLYSYRRALLSRNRVITKQDIKALCLDICGDKLSKIEIKKGFRTNFKSNYGLTPTIDVILYTNSKQKTSVMEWESIKTNILSIIEEQTIDVFPYHISIKE